MITVKQLEISVSALTQKALKKSLINPSKGLHSIACF